MALPFVRLTWFPGWRKALPKPGMWMERLKQFLAFPLYATVAWLVWVLGAQVDNDAVVRLLVTLVVLAFALWAWRAYRGGAARGFSFAAAIGLLGAAYVAWPLFSDQAAADVLTPAQASSDRGREVWQPSRRRRWRAHAATTVVRRLHSGRLRVQETSMVLNSAEVAVHLRDRV